MSGAIVGTVQVVLKQPENQQHRADVAKMLVHRRARRRGLGAALMPDGRPCDTTIFYKPIAKA